MDDLGDYYSGGYFLIRADKPDWETLQTPLLPDKLISLSRCICPLRLSIWWGWEPGDRDAAGKFGITDAQLDEFVAWCSTSLDIEVAYPSAFHSPDAARHFVQRFMPDARDLYLIGAGLYKAQAEGWNRFAETGMEGMQLQVDLVLNPPSSGVKGTEKRIADHVPMIEGGTPLGFEVIGFDYHDFQHTWHCNHLAGEMHTLFGIQPGQFGLIQTREEAQQVNDWIAEDKQQGQRAEPDPYAYWLLVSYPLE